VVERVLVAGFRVRVVLMLVDAGVAAAVPDGALAAADAVLVDLVRVVVLARVVALPVVAPRVVAPRVVVLPVDRARVVVLAGAVGPGLASCVPTAARASSRILTTIAAVAAAASDALRSSFATSRSALAF
jgi:hypothetical protein